MSTRTNSAKWVDAQARWQVKVQLKGDRKTFYSATPGKAGQREANEKADRWIKTGVSQRTPRVSLLYDIYIDYLKETKPETTWHQPESFGKNWIKPIIGKKTMGVLNDDDFQRILDAAAMKGLKRKTISGIMTETKKFFKWCRRKKLSPYEPDDVSMPGNARKSQKHILQPHHLRILFSSENTTYDGASVADPLIHLYRYLVLTGMRPGEAIGLRSKNVSANYHSTEITGAINIYNMQTCGKNDNALRVIINCELAEKELRAQRALHPKLKKNDLFFGEMTQDYLRENWYRYCAANGIPHITPYELRHTFQSYTEKYKAFDINAYVGHTDKIQSYIHDVDGYDEYKASVINNIFMELLYPEISRQKIEVG